MILGVTGTRSGMSARQREIIINFFFDEKIIELHHGDCIGVDVEIADFATELGIKTICHPPLKAELRAFHKSDVILPPKSYFARNRDIVDETEALLVIPFQDEHQDSGGTWYTHDYAKKKGKKRITIWPTKEPQNDR